MLTMLRPRSTLRALVGVARPSFPQSAFPRATSLALSCLVLAIAPGCDDESGKKNARGSDAGVGDGSVDGSTGGVAGSAGSAGSGGAGGTAGSAGSAGTAGVGGAGGAAGSAGAAGTGGSGGAGNPGTLVIDTWGDPLHSAATYIAVSDAAGWTTYSPVALGNTISHPLNGSGSYLALIGCGDPRAQARRVFVVAGSFAELPLVRVTCDKYADQSATVALGGSGLNVSGVAFSVTAGRETAYGNGSNSFTYSMQLPPATYDLILAERQDTGGPSKAEVIRQQALLADDTSRVHDFTNVPAVVNRTFTVNGSTSQMGSVYVWTAGGSFLDTNFSYYLPMDFWEPASLAAGDAILALSEEYVAGGSVRMFDFSGGGDVSMTPPAPMGPASLQHTGSVAANTRLTWSAVSDAGVYCGEAYGDLAGTFWYFSVTPSQAGSSPSFQVPNLTQAPDFVTQGFDIVSADVSTTSACAVQTPLANGVRGSRLSASQLGAVTYPEYFYTAAAPPDRGRYFIQTRFGAGGT